MTGALPDDPVRDDEQARVLAQTEFRAPLVLEAGAGTGKTTALVARIVVWLLGEGWLRAASQLARTTTPDEPAHDERVAARAVSRVVAITFTEAAAAEMATRVGEALHRIALGQELPEGVEPLLLPPPGERAKRAGALDEVLDQLVVRTIHAFCRRLLVAHPLEAGVHPRFEVDAELRVRDEVVRECVEVALREGYGTPGNPAYLELARLGKGPADLEQALAALVDAGVPPDALGEDPFAPWRIQSLQKSLVEAIERFREADHGRLAGLARGVKSKAVVTLLDETLERADALRGGQSRELERFAAWAHQVWPEAIGRVALWAQASGGFNHGERAALGADQAAVRTAAQALLPLLRHLTALDPPLFDAARRALHPLLIRAHEEMRARGAVTYSALLREARDLLVNHPEVAASVRLGIDQLLVDEFQDTDQLQCDVIRVVALGGKRGERPGLFLVGDPKQSIFGWRSADLAAYDSFVDEVMVHGGTVRRLCVNYRSTPRILEEVDRVIEPLMKECRGVQPRFQRLVPSAKRSSHPAFESGRFATVEHWVPTAFDTVSRAPCKTTAREAREIEAHALARDLVALHHRHGVAWPRIAVLLRSLVEVDVYLDALRAAGVPYDVAADRSYYQRREIIEAAALVRCVLDPNDHLALLCYLRSASVGVPDAALIPLWTRGFPALVTALDGTRDAALEGLARCIADAAAALPDDVPGIERVAGWEVSLEAAVTQLGALRASFENDPIDVFVWRLRTMTLFEATESARTLGRYRVANLERFFRKLAEMLAEEGDRAALLRALRSDLAASREVDDGQSSPAALDAVSILSIHRAKGLDFDHVYVMDLHKGAPRGEEEKTELAFHDGHWELCLFGAPNLGFHAVRAEREIREAAERVRTLYVAMTRARERLVLAGLRSPFTPAAEKSHARLLESRGGEPVDLSALAREVVTGGAGFVDVSRARWVFPQLLADSGPAPDRARPNFDAAFDPSTIRAQSTQLEAKRAVAARYAARPTRGPASAQAHEALRERFETSEGLEPDRFGGAERHRPDDPLPRAVGTAVHRALEQMDFNAEPTQEIERLERVMHSAITGVVPQALCEPTLARARELLRRFAAGPLHARLRACANQIVARELPVLLPPLDREDSPVGFVTGAIDLVYRDPHTNEFVVADYKTDHVLLPEDREARVRAYAEQGRIYVRAVREALALPRTPRFELWFLDPGQIETVPIDGGVRILDA
ncbi:MAG TPA: UvrD-helicase domain-containing protein [Myxococcota bacterium]|nr:UvrD-helicase domain-containing protein [Myxococcota bacterium]